MNRVLLCIIIIIIAVVGYKVLERTGLIENFVTYKRWGFNLSDPSKKIYTNWDTGSSPLNYYTLPIYKKPYRYPFMYHTSYPISTMRNYPTSVKNG